MDIRGKRFVVIGGAGLIGSHTVDQLVSKDVFEIVVYDNFVRGTVENLAASLKDPLRHLKRKSDSRLAA